MKIAGKQSPRTAALLEIASRRKLGLGYAADSSALMKLPGADLRNAFNFPSVRTGSPPPPPGGAGAAGISLGIWHIYMTDHARSLSGNVAGPGCEPTIFLDGMTSSINTLNDMSKAEIGLIEVFTSASRAPMEYAGSGGNCGVVLVWRKRYLRP